MITITVSDATTPIRDWLRDLSTMTAVIGTRTFIDGQPSNPTLPAVDLARIGGDIDDNGVDRGIYQFNCRGETGPSAKAVAAALTQALLQLSNMTEGQVRLHGAQVTSTITVPDPDFPDTHRVNVTAQITTTTIPT